jgi:glycine/D-amino acid oxidase-like deaminating enzyme
MKREDLYRALSFWHDSFPGPVVPRAALDRDISADVAIVGAGYTGLWTAYYLKRNRPSLDVVVLEAETAGYGASGRNGGWCSAYLSGIDGWLDDMDHRPDAIRLQRLMFDAVRETGSVAEREAIDCHFDPAGALEIAVTRPQLQRLREELARLRSLGFDEGDYRWLNARALRDTIRVEGALGAVHFRHCAAIHPARLARGLADVVKRLGATIYEGSPVSRVRDGQVVTPRGSVRAENVLLATEGYGGTLPGRARHLVPVHSMMVATEALDPQQLSAIGDPARVCFGNLDRIVTYGQRTADDRIAFGCRGIYFYGSGIRSRFDSADPAFELARRTLLRFFPGLEGVRFSHAWGGCMGVSRSLRPSVNFDPARRFGWAGGYFGNGVGAAHLAGRTLADLVLGRDTERVRTPWVNSPEAQRQWESEPMRWLGFTAVRALMGLADRSERRGGRLAPACQRAIDRLTA